MAKGTITISSQAKKITGTGTAFTDELTTGGFVVFTAGGVVYTLAVLSIESDTELTLVRAYNGPDATGAAWAAIPVGTASNVTMELVAQVTEALRGVNQEKANWQAVFSEDAEITVVLPDQSTFTGPSWLHIVELLKTLDYDRLNGLATQIQGDTEASDANAKAAAASEANAAASELAAATSEENAAASEDAAAASAKSAAANAKATAADAESTAADAQASAASAKAAATSETNAATSEENAAGSAESAAADAASTAADAAATAADAKATAADVKDSAASAKAAAASEEAAAKSERNAGTSEKNAKQYAAEAKEDAAAAAASNPDKCLRISENLADVADKAKAVQNLMDKKPLPLASDGAADSHAVTLRQLIAATVNGGGDGPTMNGVMNNALGYVGWFNGTRAKMWPGHLASDGQCLSRAEYPELWAAVKAGIFLSFEEDIWQTPAVNNYTNRAAYSKGGEAGTCPDKSITDAWFRLPDLNGSQAGSHVNAYLRGSATSNPNVGRIHPSGAPDITGGFVVKIPNDHSGHCVGAFSGSSGATISQITDNAIYAGIQGAGDNADPQNYGYMFQASRSNAIYGASPSEVRPTSAIGIWVIRVNGIFSAQDTNFSVIIADETLPDNGAIVYGGAVQSIYQAGGVNAVAARMRAKYAVGGDRSVMLDIVDNTGDTIETKSWEFTSGGLIKPPSNTKINDLSLATLRIWDNILNSRSELNFSFADASRLMCNYTPNVKSLDWNNLELNGVKVVRATEGVEATFTTSQLVGQSGGNFRSSIRDNNQFGRVRANFDLWARCDETGHRQGVIRVHTDNFSGEKNWIFSQDDGRVHGSAGTLAIDTSSDARLKTVDCESDLEAAAARIDALRFVDYHWNDHQFNVQRKVNQDEQQRGVIAQEAQKVDPRYVKAVQQQIGGIEDGYTEEILNLNTDAMLLDAMATIQLMRKEMAALQAEVSKLKK